MDNDLGIDFSIHSGDPYIRAVHIKPKELSIALLRALGDSGSEVPTSLLFDALDDVDDEVLETVQSLPTFVPPTLERMFRLRAMAGLGPDSDFDEDPDDVIIDELDDMLGYNKYGFTAGEMMSYYGMEYGDAPWMWDDSDDD
jgi:hypothetical protein